MEIVIYAATLAGFIVTTVLVDTAIDKFIWNNGYCRKCDGIWYYQSTGRFKIRKYKCDAGHTAEISWLDERPIDPKETLK